ncbi:MAG TPA: maleylpyruvate isomerase N-terminal domain-containing protein [Streptosporangiaceae bacterium]|nr:maleylpyruvate isomerase N-terminal domain-containing protein [Streptosporangiaceae bacterium]
MELPGSRDSAVRGPASAIDAPAAYRQGIEAIAGIAARFTFATWNAQTPCAEWRAADLAGHLRCVVDDYHEYLDNAPVSRLARLMATGGSAERIARKLARQNSAELAALPDVPPGEHIRAFTESAARYTARLGPLLTLPHHTYQGRLITVAGMGGMALVEWHVHAWDLAAALGESYRPDDPEAVLAGWMAGIPHLPIVPDRDPWAAVLRSAGRVK